MEDLTPSEALIEAGKQFPNAHICKSPVNPLLNDLAQKHAHYMAEHRILGHQHFQQRWDIIHSQLDMSASEIAAESWAEQSNDSLLELGKEMFKCWHSSPGHWQIASQKHKFCGAGMEQGSNGIWYACMITAD